MKPYTGTWFLKYFGTEMRAGALHGKSRLVKFNFGGCQGAGVRQGELSLS